MTGPTPLRDIVIVGTSLAGLRAAEGLRAGGYQGRIHMVGDEDHLPYNRPPLSKEVLLGKMPPEETVLHGADAIDAIWYLGDAAVRLEPPARTVHLTSGTTLSYDALIIATGVRPRWPRTLPTGNGRYVLRTLDDAIALSQALPASRGLIVLGAGFIGCEVAAAARSHGTNVTLIDQSPAPLERVLGPQIAGLLADLHRDNGVTTRFGVGLQEILGHDTVTGALLDDGTRVAGDLLLVGIGGQPAVEWLQDSGLRLDNGVVCDETLKAESMSGDDLGPIWAVGDVARWRHAALDHQLVRVEHWSNAAMSGLAAAQNILGASRPYTALPEFWSDQYGINIRGIGQLGADCDVRIEEGDVRAHKFLATYWSDGTLRGALSFDMTRSLAKRRRQIGTADLVGSTIA